MKGILLLTVVLSAMSISAAGVLAQDKSQNASVPKVISASDPVFPDEAKNHVYGESVRVAVAVDKKGKVTAARALGPLAPCSNLKDPVVTAIREAALTAARAAVFEPTLRDGNPVENNLMLTYRLRPRVSPLPETERKTIIGGVLNGKAKSLPKPAYPDAARANRTAGTVEINILIAEDGRVISAGALSGHPDLIPGAIESACGALYTPTTLAGEPVKVSGRIVYNFIP